MAAASLTTLHDAHACACFGSLVDMAASGERLECDSIETEHRVCGM
jgi:hypothetical protein